MPQGKRDSLGLPPVDLPHPQLGTGTRAAHLKACKQRALEYLPGDCQNAVASMVSDLGKHEAFRDEGTQMMGMIGMMEIQRGSEAVKRWIEGFN